jgi:hypothetical protein
LIGIINSQIQHFCGCGLKFLVINTNTIIQIDLPKINFLNNFLKPTLFIFMQPCPVPTPPQFSAKIMAVWCVDCCDGEMTNNSLSQFFGNLFFIVMIIITIRIRVAVYRVIAFCYKTPQPT